jgi:hypothetical protein
MSTALELKREQPTPLELIQEALRGAQTPEEKLAATGMVKELIALQQSMVRFEWEAQERQSRIDFDGALNECQGQIGRIAPNVNRKDTNSWWADYAQLDRTIRPIYTKVGFSIAFSEVQPIAAGKIRIRAEVSRAGVSKEYFSEITPTTTGPKGGAMATATDADAIANSRAKRYLLLAIFNIAVGIDAIEKQGAAPVQLMPEPEMLEWLDAISQAPNEKEMGEMLRKAHNCASEYKCDVSRLEFDKAGIKAIESPQALQNFYLARAKKWGAANNPHAVSELGKAFDKRKAELEGQS